MKQKILDLIEKTKNSRLLLGSFWTIVGSGLSRVSLIIGSIISANILGVEKYGEFGITRSTINLVLTIAGLNVGVVLTKYISEFRDKDKIKCAVLVTQNYIFVFMLTIFFSLVVYFSAPYLSSSILEAPQLVEEIKLSVFILFFGITFPLNESVYRGFEWFKQLGFIQILGSLTFIVFVPLGAHYYGVYGALLGYLIYTITMTLLTSFQLYNLLSKSNYSIFSVDKSIFKFKELIKFTLPVLLSSIVEAPFFWFSQVLLIKYAGMIENGKVGAILQMRNLILIVPGYVSLVSLPLLSNALSSSNKEEFKNFFQKSVKINFAIATICVLPLILFSSQVMLLFGKDFQVDFWVSFFAYISVPFLVIASVINQSLIAKGKGWINFYISLIWNLLFLACIYYTIAIMKLGSLGYMVSLFIAIIILISLKYYFNSKKTDYA
ncbi:MAG: O-antigen/teichoic acid export membrane protein [Flavobacterium sp.]|jgi:O-antigen/teichoic acid export membrane protein